MCADEATIVWFLVGPPTCLFPCTLRGLAHRPSPNRTDTLRFSLPSGKLFYRVPSIRSLPCTFVRGNYLLGFLPSSRHHHIPPKSQTFQSLLASPSVFSTVRRLLQYDLRACFIPQPSLGHLLVQGFIPFEQLSILIGLNCTHAVEIPHAHLQAGCHARAPRLRCFTPLQSRVPIGSVISLPGGRAPLRVHLLPQVHLTPAKAVTCSRALVSFPPKSSLFLRRESVPAPKTRLQRISNEKLRCSGEPERPTCSSFWAFLTYFVKEP